MKGLCKLPNLRTEGIISTVVFVIIKACSLFFFLRSVIYSIFGLFLSEINTFFHHHHH